MTATPRFATQTARTLADLLPGEEGSVLELDAACPPFARQRLLDLGLTPGTKVQVAMDNAFGDPRAYRVRGTLLALRREMAALIRIRTADFAPGGAQ